jgi:DNA-directed RNA polymerase specialized sigma subunit
MKTLEPTNASNLRNLGKGTGILIDTRPLVIYTMSQCGYSYEDIGKVFGISRQRVHYIVKTAFKESL